MTKDIQQAFQDNLDMINWIDQETKLIASEKVEAMMLRIGYPDFILDPNQLEARYRDVSMLIFLSKINCISCKKNGYWYKCYSPKLPFF